MMISCKIILFSIWQKFTFLCKSKMTTKEEKVITEKNTHELVEKLFSNVGDLINGEMQMGISDLELLEKMNKLVERKYEGMQERTNTVKKSMQQVKEECI